MKFQTLKIGQMCMLTCACFAETVTIISVPNIEIICILTMYDNTFHFVSMATQLIDLLTHCGNVLH